MYFKQIDEIVSSTKTQTRRVCKSGEAYLFLAADGRQYKWTPENGSRHATEQETILDVYNRDMHRLKWQVGRDYAVQPGRGKPGVWVNYEHPCRGIDVWPVPPDAREIARKQGYTPLRVRITAIRREKLQDITEEDAIAEGCRGLPGTVDHITGFGEPPLHPIDEYRELWESINGRGSWDVNPDVWVLCFEVVR